MQQQQKSGLPSSMRVVDCCPFWSPVAQVNLVDYDVEVLSPAQTPCIPKLLTLLDGTGHGVRLRWCGALTV